MALVRKVGVVVWRRAGARVELLLHRPLARREAAAVVPFGLARGTVQFQQPDGSWADLPEEGEQAGLVLEPPEVTARREMTEELGVRAGHVASWRDAGVLAYDSARRGAYPVHWFVAELHADAVPEHAEDAAERRWASEDEVRALAESGDFKPGYLAVLRALGFV